MATYVFLFGALVGFILGMTVCYWKQIKLVATNKDKLTAISHIYDDLSTLAKD